MTPEQLKYSILKRAFSGQLVTVEPDNERPKVKAVEYEETPFDIPEDWFWSNLGSCCDMYTGNSISESVKKAKYAGLKEGYDYIATKDVTFAHTIEYDNGVRIPINDDFRRAYSGSVLMCIEGGSAGRKIGILDRDVCFGNKLCTFYSKEIVNSYIYYYLQSHEFKTFFMDNMSGIIGGVSIKKLKELPIPVPTLSEQKAIVTKIEELLPLVERYAESYEKLEQFNDKFPEDMKKSILQYAIQGKLVEQRPEEGTAEELYQQILEEKQKLIKEGKIKTEKLLAEVSEDEIPFDIPDTWKWVRIGETCIGFEYGTAQKSKITGKCPVLRMGNIQNGQIVFENLVYTDDENDIKKYILQNGDLLFNRTNSKEWVGKTAIYLNEYPAIYAGYLVRFTPVVISSKYLNFVMQSDYYWRFCQRERTDAIGQSNINAQKLKRFVFPLPPLAEQHRIVAKIEELLPYCEKMKRG